MIFETHAHLNAKQFNDDYNEVIKTAFENNVNKILDIACGKEEYKKSLEISREYENIYTAVGIHPVDYKLYSQEILDEYKQEIIRNKKIIAYGEIGLDYHWYPETKDIQIDLFKKQIELAKELELPIIIHCRDAAEDCLKVLKEYAPLKGVIHSFSENYDIAQKFIDLGLEIGISGPVTFKNGHNQKDVVTNIDINKLHIETDSPYMSPVPKRGKRNEPSNLKYIIEEIAALRDEEKNSIETSIYNNSCRLFKER